MAALDFAVDVAVPTRVVGAYFVPQRMPAWYGAEMDSCFEVEGGASDFRAGLKVRITGKLGRRKVTLTAVVMRYERGRVLEWRFQDQYGVRGLQRWEIDPTPAGTRVHLRDEYALPGRLGRIVDWLVTRHGVAARDRRDLARLKKFAEAVKFNAPSS